LFYIILIALFAVPLMGAFVVILIKGVMDFRFLILGVGIVITALAIYYCAKFVYRLVQKIKQDGFFAFQEARRQAGEGAPVQIGLFGGLLTMTIGGPDVSPQSSAVPLLPDFTQGSPNVQIDPLERLQKLSDMKAGGVIDQEEFHLLKKKLIQEMCTDPVKPEVKSEASSAETEKIDVGSSEANPEERTENRLPSV
jgi:hypothetical protein